MIDRLGRLSRLQLATLFFIAGCGGTPAATPEATSVPVPTATPTPEWIYTSIDFERLCAERIVGREPNPVEEMFGTIEQGVTAIKKMLGAMGKDTGDDEFVIAQAVNQAYLDQGDQQCTITGALGKIGESGGTTNAITAYADISRQVVSGYISHVTFREVSGAIENCVPGSELTAVSSSPTMIALALGVEWMGTGDDVFAPQAELFINQAANTDCRGINHLENLPDVPPTPPPPPTPTPDVALGQRVLLEQTGWLKSHYNDLLQQQSGARNTETQYQKLIKNAQGAVDACPESAEEVQNLVYSIADNGALIDQVVPYLKCAEVGPGNCSGEDICPVLPVLVEAADDCVRKTTDLHQEYAAAMTILDWYRRESVGPADKINGLEYIADTDCVFLAE